MKKHKAVKQLPKLSASETLILTFSYSTHPTITKCWEHVYGFIIYNMLKYCGPNQPFDMCAMWDPKMQNIKKKKKKNQIGVYNQRKQL